MCIDSTHGMNAYDFNLTSILVIDDYVQGRTSCGVVDFKWRGQTNVDTVFSSY